MKNSSTNGGKERMLQPMGVVSKEGPKKWGWEVKNSSTNGGGKSTRIMHTWELLSIKSAILSSCTIFVGIYGSRHGWQAGLTEIKEVARTGPSQLCLNFFRSPSISSLSPAPPEEPLATTAPTFGATLGSTLGPSSTLITSCKSVDRNHTRKTFKGGGLLVHMRHRLSPGLRLDKLSMVPANYEDDGPPPAPNPVTITVPSPTHPSSHTAVRTRNMKGKAVKYQVALCPHNRDHDPVTVIAFTATKYFDTSFAQLGHSTPGSQYP